MKRIVFILLLIVIGVGFAGCSKKNANVDDAQAITNGTQSNQIQVPPVPPDPPSQQ